jgi:hypothetical protein
VSLAALHPGRCCRCHGRIERGEPIDYFPPMQGVKAEVAHVECPDQPPAPNPQRMGGDSTPLFELGDCSECGQMWTAHKSTGGLPATSPCCAAAWVEEAA